MGSNWKIENWTVEIDSLLLEWTSFNGTTAGALQKVQRLHCYTSTSKVVRRWQHPTFKCLSCLVFSSIQWLISVMFPKTLTFTRTARKHVSTLIIIDCIKPLLPCRRRMMTVGAKLVRCGPAFLWGFGLNPSLIKKHCQNFVPHW